MFIGRTRTCTRLKREGVVSVRFILLASLIGWYCFYPALRCSRSARSRRKGPYLFSRGVRDPRWLGVLFTVRPGVIPLDPRDVRLTGGGAFGAAAACARALLAFPLRFFRKSREVRGSSARVLGLSARRRADQARGFGALVANRQSKRERLGEERELSIRPGSSMAALTHRKTVSAARCRARSSSPSFSTSRIRRRLQEGARSSRS